MLKEELIKILPASRDELRKHGRHLNYDEATTDRVLRKLTESGVILPIRQGKYIVGYNPKKPSVELQSIIKETQLPKSGYLNTTMRGKFISELTIDELEYVGFDLKNGQDKLKMICKLDYFIRLYNILDKEGITEKEFDELVAEEFKEGISTDKPLVRKPVII